MEGLFSQARTTICNCLINGVCSDVFELGVCPVDGTDEVC